MDWYNYLGIVLGIVSLFFGFTTFFLYMKVRKLFSLLSEEQIKEAEPIILQQNKNPAFRRDFFISGFVA